MDPSSLPGISGQWVHNILENYPGKLRTEPLRAQQWRSQTQPPDLDLGWLCDSANIPGKRREGEKGQQTSETDGLIHHTPEINKKKSCSKLYMHSDGCKFHNCGDLPSHYTHTHIAVTGYSSWKVNSGETTKHEECWDLRKLVHKMIIQARVEKRHTEVRDWCDITVYL